jgi:hypothetical protein
MLHEPTAAAVTFALLELVSVVSDSGAVCTHAVVAPASREEEPAGKGEHFLDDDFTGLLTWGMGAEVRSEGVTVAMSLPCGGT